MKIIGKPLIVLVAKILVVSLSVTFILYKFFSYENLTDIFLEFRNFVQHDYLMLLSVFGFVFVNWAIESLKWIRLIRPLELVSFRKSYKAVLSGLTISMFTPNRTGEFLGRILVLKSENRVDGVAATIIGSFAQFIITILIGLVAAGFLFYSGKVLPEITFSWKMVIYVLSVGVVLALLVYFNLQKIISYVLSLSFFQKISKYLSFIKRYRKEDLFYIIGLSFFRYLIFIIQFFLLFQIFDIDIAFSDCFIGVGIMYFMMAVIPTFTITELGIRGSISILVFELFTSNIIGILASSVLLWIFNLALPAILGAIVFSKMKI